jgi:hypothetical protein
MGYGRGGMVEGLVELSIEGKVITSVFNTRLMGCLGETWSNQPVHSSHYPGQK